MRSLVLQTAVRYLLPMLMLFSVYLLLRGHDSPGGGFVGGLAAGAAMALYALAMGPERAGNVLRIDPRLLLGAGLSLVIASGMTGMALGHPFLTGIWTHLEIPIAGELGSPLLFDLGVYLVVLGIITVIVLTLAED